MATSIFELVRADRLFIAECEKAAAKAQRATGRARARIQAAEEREVERHRKKMAELTRAVRALTKDVYDPIYDPLEEEAFARAEGRLAAARKTEPSMRIDNEILTLEIRRKAISARLGPTHGDEHARLVEEMGGVERRLGQHYLARDKRDRPALHADKTGDTP